MKKKALRQVLAAYQQLNEVRLERIRELIRQRNDFQQETFTLKQEVADWQAKWWKQNDRLKVQLKVRMERWHQLHALRREVQDLRVTLAEKDRDLETLQGYTRLAVSRGTEPGFMGFCNARRFDTDSGDTDPHWCDKSPDHEKIVMGESPHRCGDCKKEWVS